MRNVRNFWIELEVDGRANVVAAGPAGKDGGFKLRIRVRDAGEVSPRDIIIEGRAEKDGTLRVVGIDHQGTGEMVTLLETNR